MDEANKEAVDLLIGRELNSVEFIMGYVILHFDIPEVDLTAVTLPTVEIENVLFRWGDAGYRDALCEPIGKTVRMAHMEEEKEICIEFGDGEKVRISLRPEDYRTAEAALLRTYERDLWIW